MTRLLISLIVIAFSSAACFAADEPASMPATQPTQKDSLTATVVELTGTVQKLLPGEKQWQAVKVGDELSRQTLIRTGLRSKVALKFQDRADVTVDAATKIGIGDFYKKGQKVHSQLGLKYGTVRADVNSKAGPVDFTVGTPVATLSVRGTAGDITYFSDSGLWLDSQRGVWQVASPEINKNVIGGENSDGSMTPGVLLTLQQQYAYLGDYFGGIDPNEQQFLILNGLGRGNFLFTSGNQIQGAFLPGTRINGSSGGNSSGGDSVVSVPGGTIDLGGGGGGISDDDN